jgi:hypothetical protein
MPKDNGEPLIMASLFSRDWSAQRLGWLDYGRLLWPVPAQTVSVFYEIGSQEAGARGASLLPHIDGLGSVSVTVAVAVRRDRRCGGLIRSQLRQHRSTGARRFVAAGVSPDPGILNKALA